MKSSLQNAFSFEGYHNSRDNGDYGIIGFSVFRNTLESRLYDNSANNGAQLPRNLRISALDLTFVLRKKGINLLLLHFSLHKLNTG